MAPTTTTTTQAPTTTTTTQAPTTTTTTQAPTASSTCDALGMDRDGPVVSDVTVSPLEVDLTSGPQQVTFRISACDATGIDLSSLPSPYFFKSGDVGTRINGTWSLESGDALSAVFVSTVTIPETTGLGTWTAGTVGISDTLGFMSTNGGHETSFTVSSG